ncbi:MAG: DUF2281 domain-containing protein [Cyclobacteriaceae bacterium]
MSDLNIYIKLSMMPDSLKNEVANYMDYLMSKKIEQKGLKMQKPKAGFLKGTFKMSSDFDEPLDDFNEYMA